MNSKIGNELIRGVPTKKEKRLGMIIVLGSLSAIAPFTLDMYLPALPMLAADLNTSTSLSQLSLMFCLLGLALGQLIAGPISDARGRRKPLVIGMVIFIITSILCGLTSSIWVLVALRFIQGLAGSVGLVVSRAIVRDYYSGHEMTKLFAILILINSIAPMIAPVLGGQLLYFTGWQGIFVMLGLLGIILLMGVIFKLPESLPQEKRHTGGMKQTLSAMNTLIKDRVFMGYALSQGFVFAAMFAYIAGSPFVLQEIYNLSPQGFSAVFAINSLGGVFAAQLSSKLSYRYGERKVLVSGLIISGLGSGLLLLMVLLLDAGLIGLLIPLFIVSAIVGYVAPVATSLGMEKQGKNAGSASAVIGLGQLGLGALATPLVGLGGSYTAIPLGVVIAACAFLAILSYVLLVRGQSEVNAGQ